MTAAPVETVAMSHLMCELPAAEPAVQARVAGPLLRGLELTPRRRVPAWITDPDVITSILSGLYEIDDDLCGGA